MYLKELIAEWGFPTFDLKQEDISQIKNIESRLLIGTDNAIIAIGFGQFVLEGKIDNEIKDLTKKAIRRELSQELLNQYREDYIETRKSLLKKMLRVVDKM